MQHEVIVAGIDENPVPDPPHAPDADSDDSWVIEPEPDDPPRMTIGKPLDYACGVVKQAQMLALITTDPCRRDALEAIKLAVRAMLGERKELPLDSLGRLRDWVTSGSPQISQDASIRILVDLIERREPYVRDFKAAGVREESPRLCRDVQRALGGVFERLTVGDCAKALARLLREHRSGKHNGANGVAADLILAVAAFGWAADRRQELQSAIARSASRRGRKDAVRSPARSTPKARKKEPKRADR